MTKKLPGAARDITEQYPDVWQAYANLGKATSQAGNLSQREKRLVKLALAIASSSEGAVHSHTRRAMSEDIPGQDMMQIALLAIGTIGFSRSVAAKTWIEDMLDKA